MLLKNLFFQTIDKDPTFFSWLLSSLFHEGIKNKVDYKKTVSCYQASENGLACGKCDSCRLRKEGFRSAQVEDPTKYKI